MRQCTLPKTKASLIFRTSNDGPIDLHNFGQRQFKARVQKSRMKMSGRIMMYLNWDEPSHPVPDVRVGETGAWRNLIHVSRQLGHAKASITADAYAQWAV